MAQATSSTEVATQPPVHPPAPWHCWRCILWNTVLLLWLGACGAALGAIPSDAIGLAATGRGMIKALIAVLIVVEVFRSPGGLREMIIKVAYGLLFWLSYQGLVWATGGWDGGWKAGLVGGLFGLLLGAGLILLCWAMADKELAQPSVPVSAESKGSRGAG
ncbi:MAG: hypothetical protein L0211_03730 [Planctomycetaceae bacterium]|nr:hypothetical protein [Planctomycetaceae bacterium]